MKENTIKYMEYQIHGLLDKIIDYTKYVVIGWENAKIFFQNLLICARKSNRRMTYFL